jgi:hypothetical protein
MAGGYEMNQKAVDNIITAQTRSTETIQIQLR